MWTKNAILNGLLLKHNTIHKLHNTKYWTTALMKWKLKGYFKKKNCNTWSVPMHYISAYYDCSRCYWIFKSIRLQQPIVWWIEIQLSKKLTDSLRERKERGNERRLSCWALVNKCVLSHYSHTAQYAGQSGNNECSVWCLAFLSLLLVCSALSVVSFLFLHPCTLQCCCFFAVTRKCRLLCVQLSSNLLCIHFVLLCSSKVAIFLFLY